MLKKLLLRNKLQVKRSQLETLKAKDPEFKTRAAELEAAIGEMNEETPDDDRKVIEDKVNELDQETEAHEKEKKDLEQEIEGLEAELAEEEKKDEEIERSAGKKPEERGGEKPMPVRNKFFGMDLEERTAFFADESVKKFIGEVRAIKGMDKRALSNIDLTIPDIMLPMIRQTAEETSKLLKYVNVVRVGGTSRQNIMGETPEAYWDEMCAALKELDLGFYMTEMDGFKVSGYFVVCNAILEDSDVNLASELLTQIGRAIGKALDKAIIYGSGVKMPMGIVPSLLKTSAPSGYPTQGRPWENLATTHVVTGTQNSGIKLFQEILTTSGVVDNDYDMGGMLWIMNNKTKTKLLAESMDRNSSAAIVAGMGGTMPVIGGNIETFKYIPDDTIIFGYFKNYTLAERAGTKLMTSEHVRFFEDQTAFRGTARYDGQPIIREAFAVYGIGKAPVTTAPKFAGEATE